MRHPYFHKAVMQSYEQLIPVGEMPNYFINLTVDPAYHFTFRKGHEPAAFNGRGRDIVGKNIGLYR